MNPDQPITPGEGWRLLRLGEIIQLGDEYFWRGYEHMGWNACTTVVGECAGIVDPHFAIRRRIESPAPVAPCMCIRCLRERRDYTGGFATESSVMIVCPTCGNKRCPHATDHRNVCSASNAPGQCGSVFGELPLDFPKALPLFDPAPVAPAVDGWTARKPTLPGYYWVKNWSDALERMNYRIVEIFEVPLGGWNRGGRYLGSGLYIHEHGREWPEHLDAAFGSNGEPWDQLGFMLIPEPKL